MWIYAQRPGEMFHDGAFWCKCYAGKYTGKNNPDMQDVHDIGPLPQGEYVMQDARTSTRLGPVTIDLEPDPHNQMCGRFAFRWHGDSLKEHGMASDGCIVSDHDPRVRAAALIAAGDRSLKVVADYKPAASGETIA